MLTLSPFLIPAHIPSPSKPVQFLPSQSHSPNPLTAPQIQTLWLHALSLYNPLTLSFSHTATAHKHLLKHLIHYPDPPLNPAERSVPLSSTSAATTNLEVEAELTIKDLKSDAHAPYAFFLFLNVGLLSAFQGEYYLASRRFRTALSIDDRSSPGTTAVGLYLLGLASFKLGQYLKAAKVWRQCLAYFRRFSPMDKGDGTQELEMAAPWVAKWRETERAKQGGEELSNGKNGNGSKEPEMWTGFKHKIYNSAGNQSSDKKTWEQWDLRRRDVEGNLQAALENSQSIPSQQGPAKDVTSDLHGMPGGALFWPIEETVETQPKTETSAKKASTFSLPLRQKEPIGLGVDLSPGAVDSTLPDGNEEMEHQESSIRSRRPALEPRRTTLKFQYQPVQSSPLVSSPVLVAPKEGEGSPVFAVSPRSAGQSSSAASPATSNAGASSPGKPTFVVSYTEGAQAAGSGQRPHTVGKHYSSRSNDLRFRSEAYTPSSYTHSPPTTQGSSFLDYYGLNPGEKVHGEETNKIQQTKPLTPYPREQSSDPGARAESVGEKHQKAWLALNGIAKEDSEDSPTQTVSPQFTTKHTHISVVLPDRGNRPKSPQKPPVKQQGKTPHAPRNRNHQPSQHPTSPPTASDADDPSPNSEILSLYNQLSPESPFNLTPDTAKTYMTENTIFTPPTPHYNTPTFPSFPASATKPLPKTFAAKPLNNPPPSSKLTLSEKIRHGIETVNFGFDGGEGMGLKEAMEIRERIAIEKEYEEYMKRELAREEGKREHGGELLPAKAFEGFACSRGKEEIVLLPQAYKTESSNKKEENDEPANGTVLQPCAYGGEKHACET